MSKRRDGGWSCGSVLQGRLSERRNDRWGDALGRLRSRHRLCGAKVSGVPKRVRRDHCPRGLVTLSNEERDKVAAREFSGRRNGRVPRVHRRSAKTAVRSGRCEMALDIENVVDGGMRRKEFLG
jgi:hypothetical protein